MSPSSRKRPSLVEQVREGLLQELTSGKLAPGAKLPNENQLAERFGVSRSTIRESVGGLMDAGYLARRHGSGTYVTSSARTRHPLDTTVSYTAMIRAAGHAPTETVVSRSVRAPDADERELLGLAGGASVIDVERVRFADRRPVIYSRDRIPVALLGEYSESALDSSLYSILARAGHPVASATARLLPTIANARLAKLLGIKRGTPLLHIEQVDYDERGHAVMLSREWHVADAFELVVNRRASGSSEDG
ncbi:MAG: GntR family transcriptional regulator [Solirubrobacterales bacterium]|nr:GntR family transcriptional regulator [Solirubrobacterales bacterium]